MRVHPARITVLKDRPQGRGPVICWMSRDQRSQDNWAMLHAQDLALAARVPLLAAFCLAPSFPRAAARAYDFMLAGLEETAAELAARNIPLVLLAGEPGKTLPGLVRELRAGAVVADFDPLRLKRLWKKWVCAAVDAPVIEVDAHNLVPCRRASDKQEYAARTIRPKLRRLLPEFLEEFPELEPHPHLLAAIPEGMGFAAARAFVQPDASAAPPPGVRPGPAAGGEVLRAFLDERLDRYSAGRNDPNQDCQSGLSPWLHFGQVAAQRVALEAARARAGREKDANLADFLEELVVRRELADNYCLYNSHYDSIDGAPEWARKTLARHAGDPRPHLYALEEFDRAATHDPLWNAAQRQMVQTGKMHGYLRMYWAKKILEWTPVPALAVQVALDLNDRYGLDGRDANGCAGVMWSVCGLHDRPWAERPVFGTVRYMSAAGCARKFDVAAYVRRWSERDAPPPQ